MTDCQLASWSCRENNALGRVIDVVFVATLSNTLRSLRILFTEALFCFKSCVDFHQMAPYRSGTEPTIRSTENSLEEFDDQKDVFSRF
jgi:hypothetical protein